MAEPYIGKQTDILNKLAIAAMYQNKLDVAEEYWEEARDLNPEHFDTQVNYAMYNWKYAHISDDELKSELEG